jgi:hypothetical protein
MAERDGATMLGKLQSIVLNPTSATASRVQPLDFDDQADARNWPRPQTQGDAPEVEDQEV